MTEEQIALGRRAIACNGWRWMPGMLTNHGARCLGRNLWVDRGERGIVYADPNDGELPDLTDHATLGCLLALVREAYDDSMIVPTTVYDTDERVYRWYTIGYGQGRLTSHGARLAHPTEAHALVATLEAAP